MVVRTEEAHAWVICRGLFPREAMKPELPTETMGGCLASQDAVDDQPELGECYLTSRGVDVTRIYPLWVSIICSHVIHQGRLRAQLVRIPLLIA